MAQAAGAVRLSADARSAALAALAGTEHQVLVVGGGVVGAGVALDAATRGLSVGLVEARDFAAGTSSRSSKLIHGGLRYLEQLNVGLVREALTERSLLLGVIAPHLVRPVPFVFPLTHHVWERAYIGTGIATYDALGLSLGLAKGLPGHRQLSRRGALRLVPGLKRSAITGAIAFWDGQVDDARYVLTLVRTAAHYGADVASRVQVTGFLREGARVTGVKAVDLESGAELHIRAQQVVNATGVWTDEIQAMVGGRGTINLRVSKGVHLVVPKDRIHATAGIILKTPVSVLFIIPWERHWIIGTTDTDWSGSKARPAASRADIDYLLGQANRGACHPTDQGRRHGRVRGPAAAAVRGVRSDLPAVAGACGRQPDPGAGAGRGREVHHLPADGPGRGGRRRARAGLAHAAVVHGPGAARGRGRIPRAVERAAAAGHLLGPARGQDRASAEPVWVAGQGGAHPHRGRPRARQAAGRRGRLPARGDLLRRVPRGRPAPR